MKILASSRGFIDLLVKSSTEPNERNKIAHQWSVAFAAMARPLCARDLHLPIEAPS